MGGINARMPTVRIIVRYDGTPFSGWQRQRGVFTVQQELEDAIAKMTGQRVTLRGAGRTDAGVHALAQVAAFHTPAQIPVRGWTLGLTTLLPAGISVTDAREVPDGYDPRRISGGKRYRYLVLTRRVRDPLMRDRAWHVWDPLDVDRLRASALPLVGRHDFGSFRAADCERKTSVRELFAVRWVPRWQERDDLLAFEVEGTAFLKNMVRIIVGTLVDIGRGRYDVGRVSELLARPDRTLAGMTAPPHGLYLDEVFVRPEHRLADDILQPPPIAALTESSSR